jgi:hypothetical protein
MHRIPLLGRTANVTLAERCDANVADDYINYRVFALSLLLNRGSLCPLARNPTHELSVTRIRIYLCLENNGRNLRLVTGAPLCCRKRLTAEIVNKA